MLGMLGLFAACASAPKVSEGHGGTRRTLLAKTGEVHDALLTLFNRDPQYTVKDLGDLQIEVSYLVGNQPVTLTAYMDPGPVGDDTDVEIICTGPNHRKVEEDWMGKLPEAVKYLAMDNAPDLHSPLDEGPRAVLPPAVPSIDGVRRY